jgi:hypothetical protein
VQERGDEAERTPSLFRRLRESSFWRYRSVGWRWWWNDCRSTSVRHIKEEAGMAVAAAILAFIGSINSWDAIDWFNAIRAGLIGGFSTLAALLFLIPLWRMLVAPHHVWASDQGRIQALGAERDELETHYRSEETRRKGLEQQLSENN